MSNKFTRIFIVLILSAVITIFLFDEEFQRNSKVQNWLPPFQNLLIKFSVDAYISSLYPMNSLFSHRTLLQTYERLLQINQNLETTFQCVGSPSNQSCLFKNLYYTEHTFWIFTTKKTTYPLPEIRVGAWIPWKLIPNSRRFYSYMDLDEFVRNKVNPIVIPNITVYFDQPWLSNIGHALFDGLYPAYVALIRFSPRHLQPFRIMVSYTNGYGNSSFALEVYSRFAGLGLLNITILENMSDRAWFAFEEIVIGSGDLCQRCLQPNLQLPGGIELNGSRLFRDRMYKQYGFADSSQRRKIQKTLNAYIIDNKRFTTKDKQEIHAAIEEINNYMRTHRDWPRVHVQYILYPLIEIQNDGSLQLNATSGDRCNMMAHLKLLQDSDIHVTGPGTGQMYQTFLLDGSVNINLGGLGHVKRNTTLKKYTSFLEQYITSGTPYIKGLYYPIHERTNGIKREIVIKLIQEAAQLISNGFPIPVNPKDNLAADGQLFIEMCKLDTSFCKTVTQRWKDNHIWCVDTWPEDIIHENGPWSIKGIHTKNDENITCSFNRTLMYQLRQKYNI